jgi:hypothetical protein
MPLYQLNAFSISPATSKCLEYYTVISIAISTYLASISRMVADLINAMVKFLENLR